MSVFCPLVLRGDKLSLRETRQTGRAQQNTHMKTQTLATQSAPIVIRKLETLRSFLSFDESGSVTLAKGSEIKVDELSALMVAEVDGVSSSTLRFVGLAIAAKMLPDVQIGTAEKPEYEKAYDYVLRKTDEHCKTKQSFQNMKGMIECAILAAKLNANKKPGEKLVNAFSVKEGIGPMRKLGIISESGELVQPNSQNPILLALKNATPVNAMREVIREAKADANKKAIESRSRIARRLLLW